MDKKMNKRIKNKEMINDLNKLNQKLLYECAKSEYKRECEREKIIDNKAQVFIGILVTFIALIIQKIPFKILSKLFQSNNMFAQYSIILTIIIVVIPVFIVLYKLVSIINVKPHYRFAIKELKNEKLLVINENELYDELIKYYYSILQNEEIENEKLARKLKTLIIATICIIMFLTIILTIINFIFGG